MSKPGEGGSVAVEYAIIAAVAGVLFAAVVGLADANILRRWLNEAKKAVFVSAGPEGPKAWRDELMAR